MVEIRGSLQGPADLRAERIQAPLPLTKGHREDANWRDIGNKAKSATAL